MNEVTKTLPKTGAVSLCQQWKRCGKANCRCAGGRLHGPYWYLFWRDGAQLRKRYVQQGDVPAVRAAVNQQRIERRMEREIMKQYLAIWREQLGELREYEKWLTRP